MVTTPDTIVLVHGFWLTARSWEHWVDYYTDRGFTVLAPTYPGLDAEVEALNADPAPIAALTVPEIVKHYTTVLDGLDRPPILIGHSVGGLFVQLLLDRGYGACGVAMNSAPTEGVKMVPVSKLRGVFQVLKNPANRHRAVPLDFDQWRHAFTNTFSEKDARATYDRYAVPAPGGLVWDNVLANALPGRQETWVDYRNNDRAPLLFLSGSNDNLLPPSIQHSNARHYKSDETVTDMKDFNGFAHFMTAQRGWEDVADYALQWAVTHLKS